MTRAGPSQWLIPQATVTGSGMATRPKQNQSEFFPGNLHKDPGRKEGQDVVMGLFLCRHLSFKPRHTQKTHFAVEKWDHYPREVSSPGSPRASAPSKGARGKLECLPSLASKATEHPCGHNLFITSPPRSLAIFGDRGLDSIF